MILSNNYLISHLVNVMELAIFPYHEVLSNPSCVFVGRSPSTISFGVVGSVNKFSQLQQHCVAVMILPPKGAKVYPASRRRSNKRVGLKGQLAPHCVP